MFRAAAAGVRVMVHASSIGADLRRVSTENPGFRKRWRLGLAISGEWCRWGHNDTWQLKIRTEWSELGIDWSHTQANSPPPLPPWLGESGSTGATARRSSARILLSLRAGPARRRSGAGDHWPDGREA